MMIIWDEPYCIGPEHDMVWINRQCRVSASDAIVYQKQAGRLRGYTYQDDAHALDNFMTVHNADTEETLK